MRSRISRNPKGALAVAAAALSILVIVATYVATRSDSELIESAADPAPEATTTDTASHQASIPSSTSVAPVTRPSPSTLPVSTSAPTLPATTSTLGPVSTTTSIAKIGAPTAGDAESFSAARWIIGVPGQGFFSDTGVLLFGDGPSGFGGAIRRARDGTIWALAGNRILSWAPAAEGPVEVLPGVKAHYLASGPDGQDWVATSGGFLELPSGLPVGGQNFYRLQITASNGLRVEAVPAVIEDDGYTVVEPGRLLLFDASGAVVKDWPLGTTINPYVDVLDFDGQRILVTRSPEEPAYPAVEHFVIDIQCSSCTQSFDTGGGLASLAGPDIETSFTTFDVANTQICATWSDESDIATPTQLPDSVRWSFEQLVDASAHCDTRIFQFMLYPLQHTDAYRWNLLRTLLQSTPKLVDGGWEWTTIDAGGGVSSIRQARLFGDLRVVLLPETDVHQLSVVLTKDQLVVRGKVDPQAEAELRATAARVAEGRELELAFVMSDGGPQLPSNTLELFDVLIGTGLASPMVTMAEAQIIGNELRVWAGIDSTDGSAYSFTDGPVGEIAARTSTTVVETIDALGLTENDRALAAELAELATWPSPEPTGFSEEVLLALGQRVISKLHRDNLRSPESWMLLVDDYRAHTGPFSALESISTPNSLMLGPHSHCASPPVPAPPELAGLRRVSIQPVAIDSCVWWWTVDMFLDAAGLLRGVALDLWEP